MIGSRANMICVMLYPMIYAIAVLIIIVWMYVEFNVSAYYFECLF